MKGVNEVIQEIISDKGIPRSIRVSLEESAEMVNDSSSEEEKVAYILSVLDEATNDFNLSPPARIHIWEIISALENIKINGKIRA